MFELEIETLKRKRKERKILDKEFLEERKKILKDKQKLEKKIKLEIYFLKRSEFIQKFSLNDKTVSKFKKRIGVRINPYFFFDDDFHQKKKKKKIK